MKKLLCTLLVLSMLAGMLPPMMAEELPVEEIALEEADGELTIEELPEGIEVFDAPELDLALPEALVSLEEADLALEDVQTEEASAQNAAVYMRLNDQAPVFKDAKGNDALGTLPAGSTVLLVKTAKGMMKVAFAAERQVVEGYIYADAAAELTQEAAEALVGALIGSGEALVYEDDLDRPLPQADLTEAEQAEQPAEQAEQPAEQAEEPVEQEEQPVEQEEQPVEQEEQPVEQEEQPVEREEQPAEQAEQPVEQEEQPVEQEEEPAEQEEQPAEQEEQPVEQEEQPVEQEEQPVEQAEEPVEQEEQPAEQAEEPVEQEEQPVEQEEQPVEQEEQSVEQAEEPVEQAEEPVEQEEQPVEQEEQPAEQEEQPVEQEEQPVEQEEQPVEQEEQPVEQEEQSVEQAEQPVEQAEESVEQEEEQFTIDAVTEEADQAAELVVPEEETSTTQHEKALAGESYVSIDSTNFPASGFRSYIEEYCDENGDGLLSASEINNVESLPLSGRDNCTNLRGIEWFTNLDFLDCSNCGLTSLDVSKNTKLKRLFCYGNKLTSLNLNNNIALEYLFCYDNQLTSLDLRKNAKLFCLICRDNQLTTLNVSKNAVLAGLYCEGNKLEEINLANATKLKALLSGEQSFEDGYVSWSGDSGTMRIDRTTALVSGSKVMYAGSMVKLNATNFPASGFRSYLKEQFDVDQNDWLSMSEIREIKLINVVGRDNCDNLKGIERFMNLQYLYCPRSGLTSLNVTRNTKLRVLKCYSNNLKSLNVTKNTALVHLECEGNQLTSLNVTKNTRLTHLECQNNALTSLNLNYNTALAYLQCNKNKLSKLAITNNAELKALLDTGKYYNGNSVCWSDGSNGYLDVDRTITLTSGSSVLYGLTPSRTTWNPGAGDRTLTMTVKAADGYIASVDFTGVTAAQKQTYDYKWLTVSRSGSTLTLKARKNHKPVARKATVLLKCADDTSYVKKVTVTQAASTERTPTATVSLSASSVAVGKSVKVTVKYKYARRLFLNTGSLAANQEKTVTYSGTEQTATFTLSVPSNQATGSYALTVYASNSDIKDDFWAQKCEVGKTVTVTATATVKIDKPEYVAIDACDFAASQLLSRVENGTENDQTNYPLSTGKTWDIPFSTGKNVLRVTYTLSNMDSNGNWVQYGNLKGTKSYTSGTSGHSGKFSMSLPSNMPSGVYLLRVYAKNADSDTSGDYVCVKAKIYVQGNDISLYIKQEGAKTCTLASAAMVMRSRAFLSKSSYWNNITEASIKSTAWTSDGLWNTFSYSWKGNSITMSSNTTENAITAAKLKSLLNNHPEGIVLYVFDKPHAIFLTDYIGDTFYCADPAGSYSGKRIKVQDSYMCKYYGWSQSDLIAHADKYWYVSSYNITA